MNRLIPVFLILLISCSPSIDEITENDYKEFEGKNILWTNALGNSLASIYIDEGAFGSHLDYVYMKRKNDSYNYYRIFTRGYRLNSSNDSSLTLTKESGETKEEIVLEDLE